MEAWILMFEYWILTVWILSTKNKIFRFHPRILGINTTRDISKLSQISLASRLARLRVTISKFFPNIWSAICFKIMTRYTCSSVVGEPTTTTTVRARNKNHTLLEINEAIAVMLDSNWSYFSAPSNMKGFFADGIIRCLLIQRLSVTPYTHACL